MMGVTNKNLSFFAGSEVFIYFEKMFENKIVLRDYQKTAVESGLKFLKGNDKENGAVMVLPTGSGKSLVIANIAKGLNGNVLVLQPSKEILEQNYSKYLGYGETDCSIYSASFNTREISKVTFAMIGSIVNKKHLHDHFNHIIIDECHLVDHKLVKGKTDKYGKRGPDRPGRYKEIIESIGCKVLGLTATPYRLYSYEMKCMVKFLTRVRGAIFEKMIHYTQLSELKKNGFLSKMKYYQIKLIETKNLMVNSTGKDYTDKSLQFEFDRVDINGQLKEIIAHLLIAGRNHILVFTRFVDGAEDISELLNNAGINSVCIHGKTPKKVREKILEDFKYGIIKCVLNVGVLTTGFDFPALDTIILARPTRSLSLYYQMVGRGMRIHENKKDCWVVDTAENYKRFGKACELEIKNQGNSKRVIESGEGKVLTQVFI